MKRGSEQGGSSSGDDEPTNPPSSSAPSSEKCKWIKMDMTAERTASALNNQEGRGMVVERRTERVNSSLDPFSMSNLGASISSLLPPPLASPPHPSRPRSPEWSELLHRLENLVSMAMSETGVDIPHDSEDIIDFLTGGVVTRATNVRSAVERSLLASMPPLTGPGVAKKRGHDSLPTGESIRWENTVSSFPPGFMPEEVETSLGYYFNRVHRIDKCAGPMPKLRKYGSVSDSMEGQSSEAGQSSSGMDESQPSDDCNMVDADNMDQSSEPMTKLRKHGNVPDSEIGFNSQSAGSSFAQVEKSQLTSTSGRPNLIDIEDNPPRRNGIEGSKESTHSVWNSYRERKKKSDKPSSSSSDNAYSGQPPATCAPGLKRRREGGNSDDEDDEGCSAPKIGIAQRMLSDFEGQTSLSWGRI